MLVFVSFSLFLISCSQTEKLPSVPGALPRDIVGQAYTSPSFFYDDVNFIGSPKDFFFTDPGQVESLLVRVDNQRFIYRYGYIWENNQWNQFGYGGNLYPGSDWIQNTASVGYLPSTPPFPLAPNSLRDGDNWVVAYWCNPVSRGWNCNGDKWVLLTYTVTKQFLPSAPPAPLNATGNTTNTTTP